ncbi:hypothetical protein SAZ_07475 [Streptomyces noursei ZPM]|nr:hypothetical protein SAZ_07475 [Streptomyces noursei ZPM]
MESGSGPGRRRKYCSESCGRAVRKIRSSQRTPDTKAHDEDARLAVDDMAFRIAVLQHQIRDGDALAGLRQVVELSSDLSCVAAAVVQQARDRGHKGPAIAEALRITVDKVGRAYTAERIARKMTQRRARRAALAGTPPPAGRAEPPPVPARRPDPLRPTGAGSPDGRGAAAGRRRPRRPAAPRVPGGRGRRRRRGKSGR